MQLATILRFGAVLLAEPVLSLAPLTANISPRNTTTVPCDTQFLTQPIDHSNPQLGTFQQQYQLVTEFYKPGGPILFYQGEETPDMTCAQNTILYTWAQSIGGIVAVLEHRYFGLSSPFGSNESYTEANIKYLTLDNVMSDAVHFVDEITKNVTSAENSKVIVASGSYGGFLAAIFRLNYPQVFFGSIAAAAPVRSFFNIPNPARYNWWEWISNSYQHESAEAASKIKDAWQAFEQYFATGNTTGLARDLNLCYPPITEADQATLQTLILNVFDFGTQFNYPIAMPGFTPIANPLQAFINVTLAQSQTAPIQVLNAISSLWFRSINPELQCLDWNSSSVNGINSIQEVPFSYITCTYLTISTTDISNATIFPRTSNSSSSSGVNVWNTTCEELWGVQPPLGDSLMMQYHFTPDDIVNSERIIFSRGQYDPTSSIGPAKLPAVCEQNNSCILYVAGMAHQEDLFAPASYDSADLTQARLIELETINEWLKL